MTADDDAREVDEVDHAAEADPVDHIADSPAHDQADGADQQTPVRLEGPPAEGTRHQDGEQAETPSRGPAAQQAEADPVIEHEGQAQRRRDHGDGLVGPQLAVDQLTACGQHLHRVEDRGLGQLIKDDDHQGKAVGGVGNTRNFHTGRFWDEARS